MSARDLRVEAKMRTLVFLSQRVVKECLKKKYTEELATLVRIHPKLAEKLNIQ